jgi:hypothetical protein
MAKKGQQPTKAKGQSEAVAKASSSGEEDDQEGGPSSSEEEEEGDAGYGEGGLSWEAVVAAVQVSLMSTLHLYVS